MHKLAFTELAESKALNMQISVHAASARLEVTSTMWKGPSNRNCLREHYPGPEKLDGKALDQMTKVYSSCIHPVQFIPHLFDESNSSLILQAGRYAAENVQPLEYYTSLGEGSVEQHCRHVGIPGIINVV